MKNNNIKSEVMSVMSCGSISSLNCKNCCFIILDIFLALIREGGRERRDGEDKGIYNIKKKTLVVEILELHTF